MTQKSTGLPAPSREVTEAIETGLSLPVLDLRAFIAGEPGVKQQLAADIRKIQETLGFYCVVNHGVPQEVIAEAEAESRRLFALPEDVKLRYRKQDDMQGYWPPSAVGANTRPGFDGEQVKAATVASWSLHRERSIEAPGASPARHRIPNRWPDAALVPAFKPAILRYQEAVVGLGLKLVPVYALALGAAEDAFENDFRNPEWYQRANFYQGGAGDDAIGLGAHSDHSFLTLLPMSSVPGLQVRTPAGAWMDVGYVPGAIIVNTGEWLNQLSGGRFIATPHRVLPPKSDRVTMPIFLDPDDDACNTAFTSDGPRSFPKARFYDFFLSYVGGYTK